MADRSSTLPPLLLAAGFGLAVIVLALGSDPEGSLTAADPSGGAATTAGPGRDTPGGDAPSGDASSGGTGGEVSALGSVDAAAREGADLAVDPVSSGMPVARPEEAVIGEGGDPRRTADDAAPDEAAPDAGTSRDGAPNPSAVMGPSEAMGLPDVAAPDSRKAFPAGGKSQWRRPGEAIKRGYTAVFGGPGKSPGKFAYPRAMAATPDGRLYVVDKSGRIQLYDPNGTLRLVVRTPKIDRGKPTGLGLDPKGRLLVADTHYSRVLVYSPDLELVATYGSLGPEPGQFLFITDVVSAPGGERHYTTDYGDQVARVQIHEVRSAGGAAGAEERFETVKAFGTFGAEPGQFQRPMALAVDRERRELLVADAVNHRLQVFTLEGEFKRALGRFGKAPGELRYPYDVCLDPEGRIWVAEFGNHRLQVLDSETGKSLGVFGEAGRGEGQVAFPWGCEMMTGGRAFFLDSGNNRVYLLARSRVLGAGLNGSGG